MTLRRPALRYHGGKWLLAPWVLQFFPRHEIFGIQTDHPPARPADGRTRTGRERT